VIFAKKFGQNFILRGHKFSRPLIESAWLGFNNYQSIVEVLTKAQIVRAMLSTGDSLGINKALNEVRGRYDDRDKMWDRERVKRCAEALLMASDHTKALLRAAHRDYGDNTGVKGSSGDYLKRAAIARNAVNEVTLHGQKVDDSEDSNGLKKKPYSNMLHRQANPIIVMFEAADERAAALRRHLSNVRKRLKVQAKMASKKALLQQNPLGKLQQQQQANARNYGKLQRGGSNNSKGKLQRVGSKNSLGEASQGSGIAAKLLGLPPTPKSQNQIQLPPIGEPGAANGAAAAAGANDVASVLTNTTVDDMSETGSVASAQPVTGRNSYADTDAQSTQASTKDPDADENWKLTRAQRFHVMTVDESIDLEFHGPDTVLDTEFDVSVCKIYLEIFEKLFRAHEAMKVLKAMWKFRRYKKEKSEKKLSEFLKKQQEEYVKDKNTGMNTSFLSVYTSILCICVWVQYALSLSSRNPQCPMSVLIE
jgi:hypothetical protein